MKKVGIIKCSSCGIDKTSYAKGLCRQCYDKQPDRVASRKKTSFAWSKSDSGKRSFVKYRDSHREDMRFACRKWREGHPGYSARYHSERFKIDPSYKIGFNLRRRIRYVLKNNIKVDKTLNLIGCSVEELWKYLESKFQLGMTRENHGKNTWHIDHIRPLSSFDMSKPEQQREAFHYTNLQPLWASDNLKKYNKNV